MLESNRRHLPRFKFDTKVNIDLTDINDNNLQCSKNAFEAKIIDIGVQGLGVEFTDTIKEDITVGLLTGKKKARLNFSVETSGNFVNTFAVPAWHTNAGNCFGLKYCDITEDSFFVIKNLVDKLSIINDNNVFKYLNDENVLDMNIIKKPDLCVKCKNDDNPTKKNKCDLTRIHQADKKELVCSEFKMNKSKFSSLRDIKIFKNLSQEELKVVEKFLSSSKFNTGDIILRERAFGTSMYILTCGTLEVIKQKDNGNSSVIAIIMPGNSVGEMAMVDGYVRSATVRAKTNGSVLTFKREDFMTLQKEYPKIAINIYNGITSVLCMNLRNIVNEMSEYKLSVV